MLPTTTYFLKFAHRDGSEIEEQEHTRIEDAWTAFRLFAEPASAEMYIRIELTEYHWDTCEDVPLAALEFAGPIEEFEEEYTPSCTAGDYSPACPWNAPGMSIHDFI